MNLDWMNNKQYTIIDNQDDCIKVVEDFSKLENEIHREFALSRQVAFTAKQTEIIKSKMTAKRVKGDLDKKIAYFFIDNKKLFTNNEEFYTDTETCSKCKGKCCKKTSCLFSPEDLKEVSIKYIKGLIDKGTASIDWLDGYNNMFFLRVREVGKSELDPSYGGTCSMLTENGCKFNWNERPKGGRLLRTTNMNGECVSDYDKQTCAEEWKKHVFILKSLFAYYSKGKSQSDIVHEAREKYYAENEEKFSPFVFDDYMF